jgi:hypothetical protein
MGIFPAWPLRVTRSMLGTAMLPNWNVPRVFMMC